MELLSKLDDCIARMDEEEITLQQYIESNGVKEITNVDSKTGVDRLIYNHAMNKTQLALACKVSMPTLNSLEKKLQAEKKIGDFIMQGKSKMYNRFDAEVFMKEAGAPKYSDNYNPIVATVINHKGGVAKSTTVRTMATAFALDTSLRMQIALCDFDPQGSCGLQGQPKEDNDIYLTMADIVLRESDKNSTDNRRLYFYDYMKKYNLEPEEVVLLSTIPTHLPNLRIMSSFPDDERFTDFYHTLPEDEKNNLLREFKDFVVPILKSEFDLILIDTPPQDSPITWSILLASDLIVTPVVPKELDYLSTRNFITFTRDRINQLGIDTIKEWKILPVIVDENSRQQSYQMDRLVRTFTDMLMNNRIDSSELFVAADAIHRTIYDIQRQECMEQRYASRSSYETAILSANAVKRELLQIIKKISIKTEEQLRNEEQEEVNHGTY